MFWGFVIGLVSAVMQSLSYVFSRNYIAKYHDSVKIVIFSQLWMSIFAAVILVVISPWQQLPVDFKTLGLTAGFVFFGELAYICFFRALREIEASRLSSLQGLKIVLLALVNLVCFRDVPAPLQMAAIVLSTVAAVGMNFSGGRLPLKGCIYLAVTLLCFVGTDVTNSRVVGAMPGDSRLLRALAATAYCFGGLGLVSAPLLFKYKFGYREFKDSFSYALCWFSAMCGLLASFDLLGVMLGTIIQASRGFFSVVIGFVLLKLHWGSGEPDVPLKMWIRRGIMAALMVAAMALYVMK